MSDDYYANEHSDGYCHTPPGDYDVALLDAIFTRDGSLAFTFSTPTQKADTDMPHETLTQIRERAAAARKEADRLESTAANLEFWGDEDPMSDGNVITWTETFGGRVAYTYVAVRAAGRYYVTGKNAAVQLDWERLVAQHLRHAQIVWRVTQYEELTPA
jgi:hypothetical protein